MKWLVIAVSLLALVGVASVSTKTVGVRSESAFYNAIDKKPFAAALFYEEAPRADKEQARTVKELKKTMRDTSVRGFYKDADLQFLEVNVGKADLAGVADDYNLAKVPAVLLFDDGQLVHKSGGPAILYGNPTHKELRSFIDVHLEKKLSKRIDEKAEYRASCYRDAIYYGPYYWGGYAGWPYYDNYPYNQWCGYPGYYYGGCGGCGARVGFGVSFGF